MDPDLPQQLGPHGGIVYEDHGMQFEVRIRPTLKKVDIYPLKTPEKLPQDIQLFFYDDEAHETPIELHAVPGEDAFPHYVGEIGPESFNFMHFEIAIPLGSGASKKAFKRTDKLPVNLFGTL